MNSRPVRFALASSVLCLVLAVALPGQSQAPDRSAFAGQWVLVPSVDRGRSTIQSAFNHALRDVNALMRAMARTRIDTNEMLIRRITLALDGQNITTTFQTNRAHRFRSRESHPATVTTERGEEARLTQLFRNGQMQMVFELDDARRWTVLALTGDDRLTLTTTIDPGMIEHNVHYTLQFRRASP